MRVNSIAGTIDVERELEIGRIGAILAVPLARARPHMAMLEKEKGDGAFNQY